MCGAYFPESCQCNCADVVAVLFIIATECLVGCGGIQHRILPTSPSRHPKGCVYNHGLVLVSCELGSLSEYEGTAYRTSRERPNSQQCI